MILKGFGFCGKFIYPSKKSALDTISIAKTRSRIVTWIHGRRSKIPKACYYCKKCAGWHLTSKKGY